MKGVNTKLSVFSPRTQQILDEARDFLKNTNEDQLIQLASQIPRGATDGNEKINIAFAGQYSAGKSSLLTILTGESLEIGEGIVTSKTQKLDWHGINVWDTPGLHTEIHPEHDDMTKELLSNVDLIVYVITNELFDRCVLADFRSLAFAHDRKEEMMLVVNKMGRESRGNSEAARNSKNTNLHEILAPAAPEDFHITYVDAKSWFGAQLETDEYFRQKKLKTSNIDQLVSNLDTFAAAKGWLGRFTSTLYTLEHILQEALNSLPTGDSLADASTEYLIREKNIYLECERNLQLRVFTELDTFRNFTAEKAAEMANLLEPGLTQEQFDSSEKRCIAEIDAKRKELVSAIDRIIADESQKLKSKLSDLENGDFAKDLTKKLHIRLKKMDKVLTDPTTQTVINKGGDIAGKMGQWLKANTAGSNAGKGSFAGLGGSNVHETVLKIGHMLGHKFKPYEALKWTRGLKVAGTVLAVVGIVVSVGMEVANDIEQEKISANLQKNRSEVRKHYDDWVAGIAKQIMDGIADLIDKDLKPRIDDCNNRLEEIEKISATAQTTRQGVITLLKRNHDLLCDIHRNC